MTTFNIDDEAYFAHYGILRKSGRYPWGSGSDSGTRASAFLAYVEGMKKQGLSEVDIAKGVGMRTSTELRQVRTIARNAKKAADVAQAERLRKKGMGNVAIGKQMGINESSVRSLLAEGQKEKLAILHTTANMLREEVNAKSVLDVGAGVERWLGISKEKLGTALAILKDEGFGVFNVQIDQQGTQQKTNTLVLVKPGIEYRDVVKDKTQIKSLMKVSDNGGRSFYGILPPMSVSSKRVDVNYKEDGGGDADGVIYVRPGVKDLSMGTAKYAQVRIAVNGTHYLKGMAIYKDGLPPGVDLQFNTNKSKTDPKIVEGGKLAALKPMEKDLSGKIDPDNPFGAMIRQIGKEDEQGNVVKLTSAINVVNSEGDWFEWKKSISSQVLSKQPPNLAKDQLELTYAQKKTDLDEIMSLTNPAVRKKLLDAYADSVDSSAVHLEAAHLPRQASHVILPINSMKPNEVYAPNYNNGDRVVLIRYPHGGIFEIPELTVNNSHPEARRMIGPEAKDAIGISPKVAERLSGADFDGDSVLVIPNSTGRIKTAPALERLKKFDPQGEYPGYEGMVPMDARTKGTQMGLVSNLITDMTIKGAGAHELAAAVRHSMVVIDAEKHKLNWKQSAIDNNIASLMTKYQKRAQGGADTLISAAKGRVDIPRRKPRPASEGGPIDPATGRLVYKPTGEKYVKTTVNKKTGIETEKVIVRTQKSKRLAETTDAHTLSSRTKIEQIYADHSNKLKALANQARKEMVNTKTIPYSESAAKVYKPELDTLNAKLNEALKNAPRERQAQVLASSTIAMKKAAYPDMDATTLKKVTAQSLNEARNRLGAKKAQIEITDREWEAIQAGAVTNHKLTAILTHANIERVKELATPRATSTFSSIMAQRARALAANGHTQAEIANELGVSVSTLQRGLKGNG